MSTPSTNSPDSKVGDNGAPPDSDHDLQSADAVMNAPYRMTTSVFLSVFFLGMSLVAPVACGYTMAVSILNTIGTDLHDTENVVWITGGWSVASAVSFSIAGSWSDIFGRRYVTLAGQLITLVGAIVGAAAQKTTTVAAGSTIIGFGAGVAFVSYAGVSEILPNKYRGIGLGWVEFCINIPWNALAVLLANKFAESTWRWCYYITIIYSALCFLGIAVVYFPPSRPRNDFEKSRWDEVKELDWTGLFLFTAGLTILLVGLTYLGKESYSKALVASTIPIGALITAACFLYDFSGRPKVPVFPWHLFTMVRKFTIHLLIVFVAGFIWYAMAALLPQGTLFMFTNDPIKIGLYAIPYGVGTAVGGWVIPSLVQYIRHVREQIVLAVLIQTVFTACYAAVIPHNDAGWIVLQFFGQGCFTWLTMLAYLAAGLFVPHEDLGTASGLIGTFRSAGGSIGNAIFSTVLHSVINSDLGDNIASAALRTGFDPARIPELIPATINEAVGVPGSLAALNVSDAVRHATLAAFRDTYAKAFRMVFYTSIPFGVIALAAAWFVDDPSPLLNDHVAATLEHDALGAGKKGSKAVPPVRRSVAEDGEAEKVGVEHRENVEDKV